MESIKLQSSAKKSYVAPRLSVHGTVEELTHGEGWRGSDDMFVFHIGRLTINVPYGTDNDRSS